MAKKRKLELLLLRYMPDAVKGERVNVGLVLLEAEGAGFSEVRFTRDWRRVQCIDPDADVEVLQALGRDLRSRIKDVTDRPTLLKMLNESFSGAIEVAPTSGCFTEDPVKEMETLAAMYFERPQISRPVVRSGRRLIRDQMQRAFEDAGVAEVLVRDLTADEYIRPGSRLTIDFGYRLGLGEMKLFHAVSLRNNLDSASSLADRYPLLAAGIAKKENRLASLTAIIENGLDRSVSEIDFAIAAMETRKITVRPVADMLTIAERARTDLGL